jgi:hypothetical protein
MNGTPLMSPSGSRNKSNCPNTAPNSRISASMDKSLSILLTRISSRTLESKFVSTVSRSLRAFEDSNWTKKHQHMLQIQWFLLNSHLSSSSCKGFKMKLFQSRWISKLSLSKTLGKIRSLPHCRGQLQVSNLSFPAKMISSQPSFLIRSDPHKHSKSNKESNLKRSDLLRPESLNPNPSSL